LLIDGDLNESAIEWNARGDGLPFKVVDSEQAIRYANQFDFVVKDTAARPEKRKLASIIEGCDQIIVVTTPDALSMAALTPAINDLAKAQANFKILMTLNPPLSYEGQSARDALSNEGFPVFQTVIRRYAAYKTAAWRGCLVCDVSDDYSQEGWRDYQSLTKEILK
jgi:chromosome partitioning protein